MDGIEEVDRVNTETSRLLAGGIPAEYYLDLKIITKGGKFYFDTPAKSVEITGTGQDFIFPDGKTYTVKNIDQNGITYTDPRTNTTYTETVAQTQKKFQQFEVVDENYVKFRGKTYPIGATITDKETGNGTDTSVLKRDIELVKVEKDGTLVYKTKWGNNRYDHYHNDDTNEFRINAAPREGVAEVSVPSDGTNSDGTKNDDNGTSRDDKINEWTSRADKYKDSRYLKDDYDHSHDGKYMSKDIGIVGEINGKKEDDAAADFETYFHDENVQKKFNEINGGSTIHEGEGISHHHHQTMPDGRYTYTVGNEKKEVTYLPGQLIELAGGDTTKVSSVQPFTKMYEENQKDNILGKVNLDSNQPISRIEYAAVLASSGRYSMKDLFGTADALTEKQKANFGTYKGPFFKGTKFEEFLSDEKNPKEYSKYAEDLTEDVNQLLEGYKDIHEHITSLMSGAGVDAESFYTLQCVLGVIEVGMGNIQDRLKPAIYAYSMLRGNPKDVLSDPNAKTYLPDNIPESLAGVPNVTADTPLIEQLKLGEEYLDSLKGEGENKAKLNLKDLKDEIETKKGEVSAAKTAWEKYPIPELKEEKAADGKVTSTNSSDVENAKSEKNKKKQTYDTLLEELKKLEDDLDKLEKEINDLETSLNKIMEYSMILLDLINKYDTVRQNYRKYVLAGQDNGKDSEIYKWLTSEDVNILVKNHDAIIHEFEDYDKMPVITNKSDYKENDVVLYDDAHGYMYVVQGYDPLTGELIIACIDKDGNTVGNPIRVWDQREITPANQDIFKDEYTVPTIPQTVPVPETTTPGKKPPTPTPTKPEPTPHPTVTPTVTPTKPTPTPTVPTTERPPEPTPTILIHTTPPPPGPTPTPPPYGPHTGLDAIYGTGETKQSATGLGALAGLAAGAAGLGLTGLIGDKKDEDEEDKEEESDFQMTEENKPLEHDEKEEITKEDDFSDPQFF